MFGRLGSATAGTQIIFEKASRIGAPSAGGPDLRLVALAGLVVGECLSIVIL